MGTFATPSSSPTLAIVGASGGLGASTLAAAVAARCAVHFGGALLVDLDLSGGGLEVTTGVEHVPGIRWPALAGVEGWVDPEHLTRALPRLGDVLVLSAGGGATVPDRAVADVLRAARSTGLPVIVDLPRAAPSFGSLVAEAALVVLLCGLRVRQLADADRALRRIEESGEPGVDLRCVTRGSRPSAELVEAVQEHLGLDHLGHWLDDPGLVRASERGDWPGRSGATRRLAERFVEALQSAQESVA